MFKYRLFSPNFIFFKCAFFWQMYLYPGLNELNTCFIDFMCTQWSTINCKLSINKVRFNDWLKNSVSNQISCQPDFLRVGVRPGHHSLRTLPKLKISLPGKCVKTFNTRTLTLRRNCQLHTKVNGRLCCCQWWGSRLCHFWIRGLCYITYQLSCIPLLKWMVAAFLIQWRVTLSTRTLEIYVQYWVDP